MVMSSASMPIKSGVQFEALITVLGNGQYATITKNFSPATLYSDLDPAQNTRTIAISDTDLPDKVKTPDKPIPKTEEEIKNEIARAGEGDTITIDGIEWIKVRTDSTNSSLVLLMLKGVTGTCEPYDNPMMAREYSSFNPPTIKGYVDAWYANLNSPILKRIAWKVNMSETPNPSWPGRALAGENNFVSVAFIPMLSDITHLMKANGYMYWLRDILCGCSIILTNGDAGMSGVPPNSLYINVRPCIWVTTK
jgi:hypothetical protein